MKYKRIKIILTVMGVLCLILGTMLHFFYQWSGNNNIVASFCAVNESVWEHLKLAFFPMLLMSVIGCFFLYKDVNNYIESQMIGIFTATFFIMTAFYTYSGIIGCNIFFIDIAIFIIAILLGYRVIYQIMTKEDESSITSKILSLLILITLTISFILFTYYPPKANLFKDPNGKFYGIQKEINSIDLKK